MNHHNLDRRAFVGAVATFVIGCASGAQIASAQTKRARPPKGRVVKMVARKFVFVPAELHVKVGEPLTLLLSAPEVPMGINFADFGVRADIVPGKTTKLSFTPDKAGTFTFLCDVFCGSGHEDMNGTLVVA